MASWTQNQIEALIDSYELHPCLYAVKHKDYHNKYKRNMALEEIVKKLNMLRPGTTIQDINKKIQGLRNTYSVERKKVLEATRSGMGEDEVCIVHKQLYFCFLQFFAFCVGIPSFPLVLFKDGIPK